MGVCLRTKNIPFLMHDFGILIRSVYVFIELSICYRLLLRLFSSPLSPNCLWSRRQAGHRLTFLPQAGEIGLGIKVTDTMSGLLATSVLFEGCIDATRYMCPHTCLFLKLLVHRFEICSANSACTCPEQFAIRGQSTAHRHVF